MTDKSLQIQDLLLNIPSIFSQIINFNELSNETKYQMLNPIATKLQRLNLSINDVIEVLNTYSKNLSMKNINSECIEIRDWLLTKQKSNGSWPLALYHESKENFENAWSTSICVLALLKFKYYYKLSSEQYDEKISNAVRWLFDPQYNIYIPSQGWRQTPTDKYANIYDTSIALRAILKYRSFCTLCEYRVEDPEIASIVSNIENIAAENPYWSDRPYDQNANHKDVGATSYALTILMHFYRVFGNIEYPSRVKILSKIIDTTRWIMGNYQEDFGWKRKEDMLFPSLEISCYAGQALSKCYRFFLYGLRQDPVKIDDVEIEKFIERIREILISETLRIQGNLVYQNNNWGWLEDKKVTELEDERHLSVTNTALAISTLLKSCYKTDLNLDLSVALRVMNYLLKSFNKERNTLENIYILCTVTDYLLYRLDQNLIFSTVSKKIV